MISKQHRPLIVIGGLLISAVCIGIIAGIRLFTPPDPLGFSWQIFSGMVLLALYLHQWILEFLRITGNRTRLSTAKYHHFLVGLAFIALFALHMPRAGHGVSLALSIVFLANAALGLMHPILQNLRHQKVMMYWTALHVGLSLALAPLIAVHIWFAIALK